MIETSSLYKTLFNAGAMQEYQIEIEGVMYDQDVIYDKTEISENLFDTDTFTIGSFTVSSLKVKLWLENHEIPRNAEVKFYYRYVSDTEQSEWILKFAGNVVDRTRYTDEITIIEAYSKAANYDVFLNHFGSAISSYPANARTVANLCATHLGLTIENIEDVYNGNIVEYPNELTIVQVLQNIAKSSGGNWAIVGGDKLRLVVLENTTPILEYPAQTIVQSELLSPISMVRVYWKDDSAFEAGDDSGSVLEIDNPWATQANTDYLLGVLGGYEYVPVNGQGVYADPALQLGDVFKYSTGVKQTVAKITWKFDGITTADIETPQGNEISYDNPYDVLVQQEFKKKVTLGESYQGVSIGRENGFQMLLSPDGTEENAVGRYYADLNKGMAFQTRPTPSGDWHDWMYFDMDEKTFKLELYSTKTEVQNAINAIELTPGPATYTWIRYADDVNGSGISNDPTGKTYIGFAYNKLTATESNIASDYTWSLIQGPKGDTGVKGDTGADGQTLYTWIKYSDNADGTDLYDVPKASTLYIGIATNKTTATESEEKTDYVWSKFKGDTGYTPIKGVDYFDGIDGQDGKGIVSSIVRYQNHTNGTTPPTGTWTENPSPIKGQYLWTRTVTTYTEGSPIPTYSVAYQAIDGTDGTDGRGIVSTVVDYVKSTTATMPSSGWSTTRPTVNKGEYLWTRTTINYTSGSPSVSISNSYVPTDGQSGSSAYLWVRYSQNADGEDMTDDPTEAKYIGVATTNTSTAPSGYADYQWSLIKGTDGIAGEDGNDGQTSYLHIKYSNDGGTTFTSNNGETVGDWIGTYVDFIEADSDNVNDYTWNKIKGDEGPQGVEGPQGEQGIQGPAGTNGQSQYVYIRYSENSNGSDFVPSPTSSTKYIGIANTTSSTPPTSAGSYTWSKYAGEDGEQGPQGLRGETGENGQPTYTWVKYADTPTSGMDDFPEGKKYIGLAFNKTTQTESTAYNQYQWSLMPQNIEIGGANRALSPVEIGFNLGSGLVSDNRYRSFTTAVLPIGEYIISHKTDMGVRLEPSDNVTFLDGSGDYNFTEPLRIEVTTESSFNVSMRKSDTSDLGDEYLTLDEMKFKLEKGNTTTDWTPAPEDVDSKLSELEETITTEYNSAIQIAEQSITSNVSETYTTKDELGEYKETVETRFTQTNEEYIFNFNSINQQLSDNAQLTQEEFDEINKYITFRDGKIYLGETNNPLSMVIQNDRLSFLYANTEVAYVSNHRLFITDGYFINSLRIGEFAFEPRPNGSLSFGKASPIPMEVNVVFGGELDGTDYKPFQGSSYFDAMDSQYKVPPGSQWTIWFVSFHHTSELPIVINQAILRDKATNAEFYAEETPFIGYNNTMLNVIGQNVGTSSYAGCLVFVVFEGGGFFFANPVEIKYRINGETEYRTVDITEQWGIG